MKRPLPLFSRLAAIVRASELKPWQEDLSACHGPADTAHAKAEIAKAEALLGELAAAGGTIREALKCLKINLAVARDLAKQPDAAKWAGKEVEYLTQLRDSLAPLAPLRAPKPRALKGARA